jgi:hypothetical protein
MGAFVEPRNANSEVSNYRKWYLRAGACEASAGVLPEVAIVETKGVVPEGNHTEV